MSYIRFFCWLKKYVYKLFKIYFIEDDLDKLDIVHKSVSRCSSRTSSISESALNIDYSIEDEDGQEEIESTNTLNENFENSMLKKQIADYESDKSMQHDGKLIFYFIFVASIYFYFSL